MFYVYVSSRVESSRVESSRFKISHCSDDAPRTIGSCSNLMMRARRILLGNLILSEVMSERRSR